MTLNKLQKNLIADNHKLVQKFVHRYFPKETNDGKQDLIAEGYRILCERIDSYDPKKGKYSTWVYAVLGFCLRNVYNKQRFVDSSVNVNIKKYNKEQESDDMLEAINANNNNLINCNDKNVDHDEYVDREILRDHMKKLNDLERQILEMSYSGYSTDEMVEELHLDYPNQVFYIRKKALNKLRKYFS